VDYTFLGLHCKFAVRCGKSRTHRDYQSQNGTADQAKPERGEPGVQTAYQGLDRRRESVPRKVLGFQKTGYRRTFRLTIQVDDGAAKASPAWGDIGQPSNAAEGDRGRARGNAHRS
jgi:hypothetical protein